MLNFLGRRGSRAALIEAELENLSSWAQREWPLAWGDRFGMADLKEALDDVLVDGYEYSQTKEPLAGSNSSSIARALLIGIARSGTHSHSSLEVAAGVPVPRID